MFAALGHRRRIELLDALLGGRRRSASQTQLRAALEIPNSQKGTLSKDVGSLGAAGLLTEQHGRVSVTHPDRLRTFLAAGAELAAAIDRERATRAAQKSGASTKEAKRRMRDKPSPN